MEYESRGHLFLSASEFKKKKKLCFLSKFEVQKSLGKQVMSECFLLIAEEVRTPRRMCPHFVHVNTVDTPGMEMWLLKCFSREREFKFRIFYYCDSAWIKCKQ